MPRINASLFIYSERKFLALSFYQIMFISYLSGCYNVANCPAGSFIFIVVISKQISKQWSSKLAICFFVSFCFVHKAVVSS